MKRPAQQVRRSHGEKHSDEQSGKYGPHDFAQHESEDVALLGPESHADADFARAAHDDIADRAEDAHRGQQKPDQADRGSDSGRKAGEEEGRRQAKQLLEE